MAGGQHPALSHLDRQRVRPVGRWRDAGLERRRSSGPRGRPATRRRARSRRRRPAGQGAADGGLRRHPEALGRLASGAQRGADHRRASAAHSAIAATGRAPVSTAAAARPGPPPAAVGGQGRLVVRNRGQGGQHARAAFVPSRITSPAGQAHRTTEPWALRGRRPPAYGSGVRIPRGAPLGLHRCHAEASARGKGGEVLAVTAATAMPGSAAWSDRPPPAARRSGCPGRAAGAAESRTPR
jgi:hypothetical protein